MYAQNQIVDQPRRMSTGRDNKYRKHLKTMQLPHNNVHLGPLAQRKRFTWMRVYKLNGTQESTHHRALFAE